jgi:hypothetical protein
MRKLFALLLIAGMIGWWQRDRLAPIVRHAMSGASTSQPQATAVYQWRDAQGRIQFGDHPPQGVAAKAVALKPANVVKGMSQAEINAALHPDSTPGADNCSSDEQAAQPRCIQANTQPRNLALEHMQSTTENTPR